MKTALIDTPIGTLRAVADDKALHALQFEDCSSNDISAGMNPILDSIQSELSDYFAGKLQVFKTPLHLSGTAFQQQSWRALMNIPYGETRSYLQQAQSINKPKAFRAVASANGANKFVIVIPCHRVINSNGALGGYSAGLERKEWLLELEQRHCER